VRQDPQAAKEALELLTTAYPRDFAARNNFGVYYNNAGQYEEALAQYQAATEIAPDEPGPIANAAYVLFALGRFDEASAAVDRAAAIRPEPNLTVSRWLLARITGHPRAAEFEQIARGFAGPDQIALAEASLAAWSGQFTAFQRMQDDVVARARAMGNEDLANGVALGQSITLAAYRGGKDLAALAASAAREKNPAFLVQQVSALAALGDANAARAGLKRLDAEAKNDPTLGPALVVARAYVQARDGQTDAAIAALQAALVTNPRARDINYFIADIRERAGDTDAAIAGYRTVVDSLTFLGLNPLIPAARLRLATLLVKTGDTTGATAQLDALLAQWKDADEDFPALVEARRLRETIK
jgi:tetratricopeptide (TPR) repeat protein